MTVYTLSASVSSLALVGGSMIKLEAISPTTGAAITGVKVSAVAIYAIDKTEEIGQLESGPFVLVPGPGAGGPSETVTV